MVIDVVKAAISNKPKKIIAKNLPAHKWENTIGKLWNTKVGPALGSIPKVNKDGKIIKPANTAIMVLVKPVITAVWIKFSSLFK